MHTDLQLLSRYHQRADAMAFRELMQAHASMVFATAKRITRDAALAEDVAQETFLQLARQSKQITESVAAWLHRVAWRRACNAVRDDATRRRIEDAASAEIASTSESSWAEVEAELDAVIDELPDPLRGPLVMHFLEGKSQREIAKQTGVNQSTVSRAIEAGLTELRSRLRGKGLLCGAGLGAMIAAQSASAAPASLIWSLGKLGMSGIGGTLNLAAGSAWLTTQMKLGIAAAVVVTGVVITTQFTASAHRPALVSSGTSTVMSAPPSAPKTSAAASPGLDVRKRLADDGRPTLAGAGTITNLRALASVATAGRSVRTTSAARDRASVVEPVAAAGPRHELVHSFSTPPQNPSGHLVRDAEGWIWGTMATGGEYGQGLIYKFRADGSDWQQVFSFNGHDGASGPLDGLLLAEGGSFWGVTNGRNDREPSTLFEFNPHTFTLTTMATSTNRRFLVRPIIGPDGQIWGTSNAAVYRFDRRTKSLSIVLELTGKDGAHPGDKIRGSLVADGLGYLWGTAAEGGVKNQGTIFKIEVASGKATTVVQFTGRTGTAIGEHPWSALTPDGKGYLWGTTRGSGKHRHTNDRDGGTLFKVHAATGAFTHVATLVSPAKSRVGRHPETNLLADDLGYLWGTTSYGGVKDEGAVFKVNTTTGEVLPVVTFTDYDGAAPGVGPRGHLMADGAGGAIGSCGSGGQGWLGTLYRVDFQTGAYTLLKDISELVTPNEGSQPQGGLVEGSDGWLWGVTTNNGTHHCGTVFKFDPVTHALVTIVNFTGMSGDHRGRSPTGSLIYDGQGYLWGTTREDGLGNLGTLFKIHEQTGVLTTVVDFGANGIKTRGGTRAELEPDGKGWLWGFSYSNWFNNYGAVYKVNMHSGKLVHIASFSGDKNGLHGRGPGKLAYDGHGFMWGVSLADFDRSKGCLFKIDVSTDQLTVVKEFQHTTPESSFRPMGDIYADRKGSLWFAGVIDGDFSKGRSALIKLNSLTGMIEGRYQQPGYSEIASPVGDADGLLWGTSNRGIPSRRGCIFTFNPATEKFTTVMNFTGNGSQANSGSHPLTARLMRHSDGNLYGVTRFGGPGGSGTVYRLRFGPTPMTQEASLLADGRAELHGTITPNGRDTEVAFEWDTEATLAHPHLVPAGTVSAGGSSQPVSAVLGNLKPGTTYFFRVRGTNSANVIPQRGAVLRFTTPGLLADASTHDEDSADKAPAAASDGLTNSTASTVASKHSLKVNRVPGAGAGFVRGAQPGPVYEIGHRYTLLAVADNGYIFDHWSGPGITGAQAESERLSFVFTEALAKSPTITATFVRTPFTDGVTGTFTGLVMPSKNAIPNVTNTGALRLTVSRTGTFTGRLRFDSDTLLLTGAFDTGGLARFGPTRAAGAVLARSNKPALTLAMQLNLSPEGPHEVYGTIGQTVGTEVTERSIFTAARDFYDGRDRLLPAAYLVHDGRYTIRMANAGDSGGLVRLSPGGSATLAIKLSDGTSVLASAPLSESNRAAFFWPLYTSRTGSFGGTITADELLPESQADQPFWWCRPGQPWLDVALRSIP